MPEMILALLKQQTGTAYSYPGAKFPPEIKRWKGSYMRGSSSKSGRSNELMSDWQASSVTQLMFGLCRNPPSYWRLCDFIQNKWHDSFIQASLESCLFLLHCKTLICLLSQWDKSLQSTISPCALYLNVLCGFAVTVLGKFTDKSQRKMAL